jgi:AcrR family transcriptional regulator
MDYDRNGPQSDSSRRVLPVVGQPRRERADAVRNRAAILHAAERLFAERGISAVSMDAVAAAAGVGKGTLFRRFGDKAGLAVALLDERERELQAAVLSGPPPLGPGAPPGERLRAFASSYVDFAIRHVALLHVSETGSPGARYRIGSYRLWHRHVAALLAEARPDLDAEFAAHALLAALSADVVTGLLRELDADRLRAGVDQLVAVYLGAVHSGSD